MDRILAWVDFSEQDRQRMLDVVQLFREQGVLDELGIGVIRDAFADYFFPGTSTIQTRARYMFFIPWIYLDLERRQLPSSEVAVRAREREIALIKALKAAGETRGVIGIEAVERLQRLPSSIYWVGLGAWHIRRFEGSLDQYHRSLNAFYRRTREIVWGEDRESVTVRPGDNWSPLPAPPSGWPSDTSLALRREEAEYLCEHVREWHRPSLLGQMVELLDSDDGAAGRLLQSELFWDDPFVLDLRSPLRDNVTHGRNFSAAIYGATLCYNLLLARQLRQAEPEARYDERLLAWKEYMRARLGEFQRWRARLGQEFWVSEPLRAARISAPTRAFVDGWLSLALDERRLPHLEDDSETYELIRRREVRLKGARAKLENPRSAEKWSGASAAFRLDYRWSTARVLLADILDGLTGEETADA